MKPIQVKKLPIILYCAFVGLASLFVIGAFATSYPQFGEKVPVYLAPWGGSWGDKPKNLFYVFRMPVMALCLQLMLLGLYPDRMEDWAGSAYRGMAKFLMGLSIVTLSQLTLNPYITFMRLKPIMGGIILCGTLAGGLALTILGYIELRKALKPISTKEQPPFSLMLSFIFKGCRKRRILLIAAVTAFMILLVIPSL